MSAIITPAGAARIKARKPIAAGNGYQPWMTAYTTRGGGYIIASDGRMSDNGRPRDLVYVWPGGAVVQLTPVANPDLVAEIEAIFA